MDRDNSWKIALDKYLTTEPSYLSNPHKPYNKVIALKLPDGVNYYTGKAKFEGTFLDEWDLDINYAIQYRNKIVAKKRLSIIRLSPSQNRARLKDYETEKTKYNAKQRKQKTNSSTQRTNGNTKS